MTLNLAEAYAANKKYDQARTKFEDVIAQSEAQGASESKNLYLALIGRARLLAKTDSGMAAERSMGEVVKKAEALFGESSIEVARAKMLRADLNLYLTGAPDPERVRSLLKSAAEILEGLDGDHSAELATVYHQIAKFRMAISNNRGAIEYFDKSLNQLKNKKNTATELRVRANLIQVLDRVGDDERCDAETQLYAVMLGEGDRSQAEPLTRFLPIYPERALHLGKEGAVWFKFGVSKTGHVMNPTVVKAEPPGYFEKNALKAFEKWRYAPRVVGGQPVDSDGYEGRVVFSLER